MTSRSSTVTVAKPTRSTVAAMIPTMIALLRWRCRQTVGGEADDHGIVAGEQQIDGDDLDENDERPGR